MRERIFSTSSGGLLAPLVFGAGVLLLVFAPVIRGGNRHGALIMLEWLGLLVLLMIAVRFTLGSRQGPPGPPGPPGLPAQRAAEPPALGVGVFILALAPLWTGLLQLTPLPVAIWASLPGRAIYSEALSVAQVPMGAFRPLSLTPDATWVAVLAGIPIAAAFLLAHSCSARQLALLVRVLVALALMQVVLGLLQLGPFPELSFGVNIGSGANGRAIGSFANPNHFASYIAMTVPLAVLLLRQAVAAGHLEAGRHGRHLPVGSLWGLALFVLLAGVLASGSRGGTVTCLVAALLAVLLLPLRRNQAGAWRWWLMALLTLLVVVGGAVGVDALLSRLESDHTGYFAGDRWLMLVSTWHAALTFWPAGSGLGSFAAVYPRFQPAGVVGFAEHAHSDFVELLMECGLLFGVLAALAAWLFLRQVLQMARRARAGQLGAVGLLQASCGLGLLAVLLHSWVDFNLRIPANAMSAAFLLGAFLRPLAAAHSGSRRSE